MENNMQSTTGETKICTCCHRPNCSCGLDIAMLLLRLGLAGIFLMAGIGKLTHIEMASAFFAKMGLAPVIVYLVAIGETVSGLAMLLGVFTKYAGYVIALIMLGAIYLVHWKIGFGKPGGPEYTLMLFLMALAVSFAGPGKYSVLKSHCGDMCMGKCDIKHKS